MSLRDNIKNCKDLKNEIVEVPRWFNPDGTPIKVLVKELSSGERLKLYDQYTDKQTGNVNALEANPAIVIATVFDPITGESVFTNCDEDRALLNGKSTDAVGFLLQKAMSMNGMDKGAVDEAKNA